MGSCSSILSNHSPLERMGGCRFEELCSLDHVGSVGPPSVPDMASKGGSNQPLLRYSVGRWQRSSARGRRASLPRLVPGCRLRRQGVVKDLLGQWAFEVRPAHARPARAQPPRTACALVAGLLTRRADLDAVRQDDAPRPALRVHTPRRQPCVCSPLPTTKVLVGAGALISHLAPLPSQRIVGPRFFDGFTLALAMLQCDRNWDLKDELRELGISRPRNSPGFRTLMVTDWPHKRSESID